MATITKGKLTNAVKLYLKQTGTTPAQFKNRLELARLWHDPLNLKDGEEAIRFEHGWDMLFPEARRRCGLGTKRFYFKFTEVDCTDFDAVATAFYNCKNYRPYLLAWKKYAPLNFNDEIYFILSLTTMTVKGMKHEKKVIEEQGLIKGTFKQDYEKGIDAWTTEGRPVQIKSPATQYLLDNRKR